MSYSKILLLEMISSTVPFMFVRLIPQAPHTPDALFCASDVSQMGTQIAGAWEGTSGLILLAFVL